MARNIGKQLKDLNNSELFKKHGVVVVLNEQTKFYVLENEDFVFDLTLREHAQIAAHLIKFGDQILKNSQKMVSFSTEKASWSPFNHHTSVERFCLTGKTFATLCQMPILCTARAGYAAITGTMIYNINLTDLFHYSGVLNPEMEGRDFCGMFENDEVQSWVGSDAGGVVLERGWKGSKYKAHILVNADQDENILVGAAPSDMPQISFNCIARFFSKDDLHDATQYEVMEWLGNGSLEVMDFTPESKIPFTEKELKAYKQWQKKSDDPFDDAPFPGKPPEKGYTAIMDPNSSSKMVWHRTSNVVLRDQRTKSGLSMLFGQDEGTYFGCELVDHPTTVKAALLSLMPEEIRKLDNVLRQGEWFLVPVVEKKLPPRKDWVVEFKDPQVQDETVSLARETNDSAFHYIECDQGFVTKDGKVFLCNVVLTHSEGDHADLNADGWHRVIRNTALRSFSEDGVD